MVREGGRESGKECVRKAGRRRKGEKNARRKTRERRVVSIGEVAYSSVYNLLRIEQNRFRSAPWRTLLTPALLYYYLPTPAAPKTK